MLKPKLIASKHVHRGSVIDVSTDRLRLADGQEFDMDFVRHPGAAAIAAVDAGGRVCLVRQYRHGVDDFLWEIPAGKLDAGEEPLACAVRELAEETGIRAQRWTYLGLFIPAPSIFTELIHLYLARDLDMGTPKPDSDEELQLQWMPLSDAVDRVLTAEWNDGKTALGLLRAQHQLQL
jgi:8-oxo-dGTP pyrophosphatase MutT (NUDIX family)